MTNPKKYVGEFEIHIGHIPIKGSLFPLNKSKPKGKGDGSYQQRGPNGEKIQQVFRNEAGEVFDKDVLTKVRVDEDGVDHPVNVAAVAEARKSDAPKNHMFVNFFRASEVEDLWPARDLTSYVFIPDPELVSYEQFNNALVRCLTGSVVALAEVNLRGSQNLYRLVARDGYLVLQPQAYTDALNEYPTRNFSVPAKVKDLLTQLIEKQTGEWNSEDFRDTKIDRFRAAEAVAAAQGDAVALFKPETKVEPDLIAQLEAALLEG